MVWYDIIGEQAMNDIYYTMLVEVRWGEQKEKKIRMKSQRRNQARNSGGIIYRVLIDRWRYSWIDRGDIVEWIRDEKTD